MYIKVRVTPKAKKAYIERIDEETYAVAVKEPAENNRANKAVLEALARELNMESKHISLVTGHHRPNKIVFVTKQLSTNTPLS